MKIAVAGTGYVGLSIATLLSQHHEVVAVDVIPEKVTAINYDGSVLTNAKLTLRLTNNWCANGRKWSKISLAPLSASGVVTGDARNIVVPVVVMLVSVVAVAFVLMRKKIWA